jgi:DNA repair protein RadC
MANKTEAQHDYLIPELKLTQVSDIRYDKLPIVKRSDDAANIISQFIAEKDLLTQIAVNEFAFVLYMNSNNRVIGITNLSVGGIDATLMDIRLVFSMAVKIGAVGIITAHNHPSGNLQPSDADIKISSLITQGGKTLSIRVLDFMIITTNSGYYSFADESRMEHGGMLAKGGAVKPKINAIVEYEEIKTPETNDGYTMVVTLLGYDRFQKSDYPTAIEKAQTKRMLNEDRDVLDKLGIKYKLYRDISAPRIIIPKIDDKYSTIKLLTKYVDVFSISNKDKFAIGGMMADGGEIEGVDLFEDYEDQPQEVQMILSKYEMEDNNYETLQNLKAELESIGYTMDYGLDAEPYDLRKIGQVGKSEFMAKGGITEHGLRVGDTIVSEIDKNTIVVENPASGLRTINISTGNAMAKGGRVPTIKESDIQVGRKFELANGEIIEIKKLFTDTTYRDENRVEYSRDGELAENGVNALKIFINNFRKDITVPSLFAEGGRMGFKALSQKVAQNYEGKSVPAKYRSEYGSRYDKEEAKEVGNKVAAKVYRMQQGK